MSEKNLNKKIKDIMKTDIYALPDQATIKDAIDSLVKNTTSGLIIYNVNKKVVGFVSDGDIMKHIAKKNPQYVHVLDAVYCFCENKSFETTLDGLACTSVMEIATRKVIFLEADSYLDEAAKIMFDKKIKKAPVVENGELVGVISRADILRYILSTYAN